MSAKWIYLWYCLYYISWSGHMIQVFNEGFLSLWLSYHMIQVFNESFLSLCLVVLINSNCLLMLFEWYMTIDSTE